MRIKPKYHNLDQEKVLEERFDMLETLGNLPRIRELQEKLLQIGGDLMVPHMSEPELDQLLFNGKIMNLKVSLKQMKTSNCHGNTAKLWKMKKIIGIGTGYGLSADGLWRQHSWGLNSKGIVETTEIRNTYFGIKLTGELADYFTYCNLGSE